METISSVVEYILSFQAYTMLPLFILVFAIILRIPLSKSLMAAITIAVGFVGIFMVFDFFVSALAPAVQAIGERTGVVYPVLDVGWPPLAAITWAYPLAGILIPLILIVNILMIIPGWTKTVNIDLWNFWHFIFLSALVYQTTGSTLLAIGFALIVEVIILKLADGARYQVGKFGNIPGITVSTLSAMTYYPLGIVGNWVIERIPGLKTLDADPESIRKKLGILGEPMVLGFIIGAGLGIAGGYEIRDLLELAVKIAAVVALLPVMAGILGKGLMIVSEGMTAFLKKYVPRLSDTVIGLDIAVLVGNTSVVVSGLILIPIALFLSFILPGIRFIPIGDLANMVGLVAMITVACGGNVIRSVILGIPAIIASLYTAGYLAPLFTQLAASVQFTISGYSGEITSFLDGGNVLRVFLLALAQGHLWGYLVLPLVGMLLFATWKILRRINKVESKVERKDTRVP